MDPQKYLEFDSALTAAQCEEWIGREYARSENLAYPMPPDPWIGPPSTPPPSAYTHFYDQCKPKAGSGTGGVFVLDDSIMLFATQPQTLSDGHEFSINLSAEAKTFEQLTPEGQAAVTPPS